MLHELKVFLAVLPVLLLDYLWLGRLMQGFYLRELGDLARREGAVIKPRLLAAAGVYLALPGGIVLFALPAGRSLKSRMVGTWLGISLRGHRLRRVQPDQPGDPAPLAGPHGRGGYLLGRRSVRDGDAGR